MESNTEKESGNTIRLKRAYEPASPNDGLRVLVDRLWARGISKEGANLNAWMKELGPSSELREWFGHRPERWSGFQERYRKELTAPLRQLFLALLQSAEGTSTVTLIYGARDTQQNEAVVLRDYLLAHNVPRPAPSDNALVVLAAIAAVADAQPSGEAPASRLAPFIGSLLAPSQLEATIEAIQRRGDLQKESGGWRLTPRGKRLLQGLPSVAAKPR